MGKRSARLNTGTAGRADAKIFQHQALPNMCIMRVRHSSRLTSLSVKLDEPTGDFSSSGTSVLTCVGVVLCCLKTGNNLGSNTRTR